jgi:glutamine amidotransferase
MSNIATKDGIAIIDYKMGNLYSVKNAFDFLGIPSWITSDPEELLRAKAIVLPGVGAFAVAMKHLEDLKLAAAIKTVANEGRPLLGICLGMQLLFSESDEFGTHQGLDVIAGKVLHLSKANLQNSSADNNSNTKVPNVGWRSIAPGGSFDWSSTLLQHVTPGQYMYFTHSHFALPDNDEVVLAKTSYGDTSYCSAVSSGNIIGTQFHPEKSGKLGLAILKNFAKMSKNYI